MSLPSTDTAAAASGDLGMPPDAGALLLPLARSAIAAELGLSLEARQDAAWLQLNRACFVTLMHHGELRGCMGTLEAHRSLLADVRSNAVAAAFRDPRFAPVTRPELAGIRVEVSVLSPLERIVFRDEGEALAQLRPGVDGLVFEYGYHRSTFLPQVWEQFRDAREFLGHLRYKAGLPPDFWDPAVKLSRYTVTKWVE
jgi:AmmeMemoRadiSam system protein A